MHSLEARLAYLEKHVEEQDGEIYQLAKRIDTLVKIAREQKEQLTALAEPGSGGSSSGSPADERPPHY